MEAAVATLARLRSFAAVGIKTETSWLPVGSHRLHPHQLWGHADAVRLLPAAIALTPFLLSSASLLLPRLVLQAVLKVCYPLE